MTIYDYSVPNTEGTDLPLSTYRGKVLLIVNTATACGFTPHYKELEALYEKYHAKGLEIIDIPCNQFGAQAPGTDAEIREFCTTQYHTQFPQMKKSDVNGKDELPLYAYLKDQKGFTGFGTGKAAEMLDDYITKINPDYRNNDDIKWNFTKFVIARDGAVAARFEPTASMADVEACIVNLL